ncbi:hypothetical protein [Opitutus terrae]|uniref:Uncharacterized protein n=1 Tax=Opitutus terrae (strain DSM 11246 / JCM 15787 / PB90-1) TaxID=452637 RepID=B1ZML2_OPITP|nr:hypothetical protein [Opitutus terrae]ACB74357.1 conserved hypothetical protein [Opitutus terrae PB90-1]
MRTIVLNVLALLLGFLIGGCVNMGLVMLGPQVIPAPAGVDVNSVESMQANAHLFEAKHFLFPFLAHALGTLAGALAAYLIAATRKPLFAYAIGVLTLAGGIAAAFMIPAPAWFIAADLLLAYLPMTWLAVRLGQRLQPQRVAIATAAA